MEQSRKALWSKLRGRDQDAGERPEEWDLVLSAQPFKARGNVAHCMTCRWSEKGWGERHIQEGHWWRWDCRLGAEVSPPFTSHLLFLACLRMTPIPPFKNYANQGFPGGSAVKKPPANAGDTGSIPDPGRSHLQLIPGITTEPVL